MEKTFKLFVELCLFAEACLGNKQRAVNTNKSFHLLYCTTLKTF